MRIRLLEHVMAIDQPKALFLLFLIFGIQLTRAKHSPFEMSEHLFCGPEKELTVAWENLPPYIFTRKAGETHHEEFMFGPDDPDGALHNMLYNMTVGCCADNYTLKFMKPSGSSRELEQLHKTATLILPVTREPAILTLHSLAEGQTFLPVVDTPGSFILIDATRQSNTILVSLLGSWPLALVIIAAAGVAGIIIWLLERRHNSEEFPKSFLYGAGEGTWWAFVTMTTVGYGDKSPRSVPARIFGLIWMFSGIVLMSVFTATLVMSFGADDTLGDLKGHKVGVLWGSFEEHQAFYEGAHPVEYKNISELVNGIKTRQIDSGLVELNFALYSMEELANNGIKAHHIIKQESVHGIQVNGMPDPVVKCFAKEVSRSRFSTMDFIMHKTGRLKVRDKKAYEGKGSEDDSNTTILHKSSADSKVADKATKLNEMNIHVAYSLFGVWVSLVIICVLWEFLCFRKNQGTEAKAAEAAEDAENGVKPAQKNSKVAPSYSCCGQGKKSRRYSSDVCAEDVNAVTAERLVSIVD